MPKEWNNPSDYLSPGLYANQNRKAIFRTLLSQEKIGRDFNAMEYEEAAADLSLKKEKPMGFDGREKCSYPKSYSIDESIDLSTKWRAPPTSERKHGSTSNSNSTLQSDSVETSSKERTTESRGWNRSLTHHIRLQPRKRLRQSDYSHSVYCPDVVEVSDDEKPRTNGHVNGYESDSKNEGSDNEVLEMPPLPVEKQWDPDELKSKKKQLKEIRDELRSEEMKLVLLKKLHQSQMIKENVFNPAAAVAATSTSPSTSKMVPTTNRPPSVPQSFSRTGLLAPASQKLLNQVSPHQSLLNSSQLNNQGNHSAPQPLIGQRGVTAHSSSSSSSSLSTNLMAGLMRSVNNNSLSRTSVTTPPNLNMGYPLQSVQNNHHIINQAPPSCSSPQSTQNERLDNQTPAQRQAAAKLALRKQLEKTLLQIPPPKPPPPEMHFIPNANNQEFICLLGLEKIVDCLIDDPNINRPPPDPFECVQCGTDFSPVWKWQDAGNSRHRKPAVICETCVTSNIKKALKAEHTNRLKTAFVKALQQEQEIEQRMSQAMLSPPPQISPTDTPSSTPTPTAVSSSTSAIPTPPAPHSPVHGLLPKMMSSTSYAGLMNPTSLLSSLPHLSKLNAATHQSLFQAQAQQLQQFAQSLPQPQPAHMLPFSPLLAAQAYSYQLLGKSHMTSAELQRQYLLDMIPSRSLPQSSMNWKT